MIWTNRVGFRKQQRKYYDPKIETASNKPHHRVWNFLLDWNSGNVNRWALQSTVTEEERISGGQSTEVALSAVTVTHKGHLMDILDVTKCACSRSTRIILESFTEIITSCKQKPKGLIRWWSHVFQMHTSLSAPFMFSELHIQIYSC
jgi:hypothetical protein